MVTTILSDTSIEVDVIDAEMAQLREMKKIDGVMRFPRLLEHEKLFVQEAASKEIWIAQACQFTAALVRDVLDTMRQNAEQGLQYRLFYPHSPHTDCADTGQKQEVTLLRATVSKQAAAHVQGYGVDPQTFPYFAKGTSLMLFYHRNGLPFESILHRVVYPHGLAAIESAFCILEGAETRRETIQALSPLLEQRE